jgi:uncharacterized protein YndB with AHSA1/START domain
MKWILIVLGSLFGLLVLGVVVLLAMGSDKDANRMTSSIVIHKKPETVWPWLYKPDKVKQWVTWLVDIREEGSGEPVVGGKAVWVMEDRNNGNQRMEITGTVKAVDPGRYLDVVLTASEGFHGEASYTLTPLPDGSTRLDSDSRYVFENSFARLMTPMVMWQARKKMVDDQSHLRSLLELP